ncbi:MAG TPA: hypothetical protein DD671_18770 [Balneolaceae bacterium]|nr:hypothetical protein [Balneolaceae bacterium]
MSKMVKISQDYVKQRQLPSDIGLVIRGPYEHVMKLTQNLESCEVMYDVLIDGNIVNLIPVVYCQRLKR